MAVGSETAKSSTQAMADLWNGSTWSAMVVDNPSDTNDSLSAASCPSAQFCVAVGATSQSGNGNGNGNTKLTVTLAEEWAGNAWSVMPTPNPTGPNNATYVLTGVSCPSSTFCTAVGYENDGGNKYVTVIEQWDGSTWQLADTNTAAAAPTYVLQAVSCPSSTFCMAVGNDPTQAVAMDWNGTSWSTLQAPSPGTYNFLDGVSCPSATSCIAVGNSQGDGNSVPDTVLADQWDGQTWKATNAVVPSGDSWLDSVSCASITFCLAVGHTTTASSSGKGLSEAWDGTTWYSEATSDPSTNTRLDAVSCVSPNYCVAGGQSDAGAAAEVWQPQPPAEVPEAPMPILLGGLGLVVGSGGLFIRRRRRRAA